MQACSKSLFVFFILTLLLLPCSAHEINTAKLSEEKTSMTILIAEERLSNGQFLPPSAYLNKLLAYLERESGVKLLKKRVPWQRAIMMAMNGDGAIFGISKTEERLEKLHFSPSLTEEYVWAIYSGKDTKPIESVNDLKGLTIILPFGVSYGLEFERAKASILKYEVNYGTFADQLRVLNTRPNTVLLFGLRDLKEGKETIAFFHEQLQPLYIVGKTERLKYNLSSQALFTDTLHIATAKNKNTIAMARIDEAIRKGIKSGDIPKIMKLRK